MIRFAAAALGLSLSLAGCMSAPAERPLVGSIEDQKREIAAQRDRGEIGYAEATQRQYVLQSATYSLTPGEEAFWRESLRLSAEVDAGGLSPADYRGAIQVAYARNVGG